jgi:hypothetical protein
MATGLHVPPPPELPLVPLEDPLDPLEEPLDPLVPLEDPLDPLEEPLDPLLEPPSPLLVVVEVTVHAAKRKQTAPATTRLFFKETIVISSCGRASARNVIEPANLLRTIPDRQVSRQNRDSDVMGADRHNPQAWLQLATVQFSSACDAALPVGWTLSQSLTHAASVHGATHRVNASHSEPVAHACFSEEHLPEMQPVHVWTVAASVKELAASDCDAASLAPASGSASGVPESAGDVPQTSRSITPGFVHDVAGVEHCVLQLPHE